MAGVSPVTFVLYKYVPNRQCSQLKHEVWRIDVLLCHWCWHFAYLITDSTINVFECSSQPSAIYGVSTIEGN